MPIFTFMSASDLQRDDAYSFGVVEKVRPNSGISMPYADHSDRLAHRPRHD
jgi:U3 small nucleolar RNA-associated protein 10